VKKSIKHRWSLSEHVHQIEETSLQVRDLQRNHGAVAKVMHRYQYDGNRFAPTVGAIFEMIGRNVEPTVNGAQTVRELTILHRYAEVKTMQAHLESRMSIHSWRATRNRNRFLKNEDEGGT